MEIKKIAVPVALLSLFLSFQAYSIDSIHVECKSCQSESQFIDEAKANSVKNETLYVNVMNFKNHEIRKFEVTRVYKRVCDPNDREPDGEGGIFQPCLTISSTTAKPQDVTNKELNAFLGLADAVNDANNLFQRSIEIPASVTPSAFDLVGSGTTPRKITLYFDQMSLRDNYLEKGVIVAGAASKIVTTVINFDPPKLAFSFSDDTQAFAIIDFVDMDDRVHLKFIKVVGGDFIEIDLTKDKPFDQSYDLSGVSLATWQSLFAAFKAYGLAVVGSTTKIVPRGTVIIIECSGSTEPICRHPL